MVSNQLLVDSRLQELKTGCVKRCGQGVLKDVLDVSLLCQYVWVRVFWSGYVNHIKNKIKNSMC